MVWGVIVTPSISGNVKVTGSESSRATYQRSWCKPGALIRLRSRRNRHLRPVCHNGSVRRNRLYCPMLLKLTGFFFVHVKSPVTGSNASFPTLQLEAVTSM